MNRKTATIVLGASLAAVLAVSYGLYSNLASKYHAASSLPVQPLASGLPLTESATGVSSAPGPSVAPGLASVPPSSVRMSSAAARLSSATPQASASSPAAKSSSHAAPSSGRTSGNTVPAADLAPDFTVYSASGKAVKLSDFRGKPVVLNFWASWCYYCKQEMPDFNEAYKKYKGSVQFLFVDWTDGDRETQAAGAAYLKSMGYSFPAYYDLNQDAVAKYGLTGIPATYYIDRQGRLVSGGIGATTKDALEQGIASIR